MRQKSKKIEAEENREAGRETILVALAQAAEQTPSLTLSIAYTYTHTERAEGGSCFGGGYFPGGRLCRLV